MSAIHFESTYDDSRLDAGLRRSNQKISDWARDAARSGETVEQMFNRIRNSVLAFGSIEFGRRLSSQIISVRGEFQQLGIALETMLVSKEKADKLMSDAIVFAQKTPFTLTDVASNIKQLMAMGIETEKVMTTMKSLGDVAAGVSVPISRIAINYGQVAALGRLQQREIRDFAMAGIPIVEELGKQFGKTTEEVNSMVEAGQIGFPAVEKAFASMAGEGGKFYNLMEKQNASVTGQISNLQDKIEVMLNSIGEANEDIIYGAIEGLAGLVENYEEVGKAVVELAAVYGTYKTALVAVNAINTSIATVKYTEEAAALYKLLTAEQQAKVSKAGLSKVSREYSNVVKNEIALNIDAATATLEKARLEVSSSSKVMQAKRNEYTALKQIEAQRIKELATLKSRQAVEFASIKRLENTKKIEIAERNLAAAATKRETAAIAFQSASRDFNTKKTAVETAAKNVNTLTTKANTASQAANATATNILSTAKAKLAAVTARVNAVIKANPYTAVAVAVAALGYGIYKLVTYQTDAEKAQQRLNNAIKEGDKASLSEIRNLTRLKGELSAVRKGTEEYDRIKKEIVKSYGKYNKGLEAEIDKVGLTAEAYKDLTDAITQSFGARQYNKFVKDQSEALDETMSENLGKIQDRLEKELGVELGSKIYTQIRNALLRGEELSSEVLKTLGDIQDKGTVFADSRLDGYIQNIRNAQKLIEETDQKARVRFGISPDSSTSEVLSQYKELFKKVGEYTDQELLSVKSKLTELLGKDLGSSAEAAIKNQIDLIGSEVYRLTNEQEIEKLTNELSVAQEKLKELMDPGYKSQNRFKDIEDQKKAIEDLKKKIVTLTGVNEKDAKKQLKLEEERLNALRDLAVMESDIQQNKNEALVSAMREGAEKQLKEAENSHQKRLAQISKQEQDYLLKLNDSKGLKITDKGYITELPADIKADFNQQKIAEENRYGIEIEKINKETADSVKRIWNSATEVFVNDTEREIRSVNEKYDQLIEEARKAGENQEAINKLNIQRQKEINEVTISGQLEKLGFDEDIETQRAEIATQGFNREAEIEKKKLQIVIKYAKLKLDLLKKSGKKENQEEIKLLEGYISSANAGLKKLQQESLQKTISDFKTLTDQVKSFSEVIGITSPKTAEFIDNLSEALSGMSTFAAGYASGNPMLMASGGLQTLESFIDSEVISDTKEYRTAIEELKNAYDSLSYAMQNAVGVEKVTSSPKAKENIEAQIEAYERLIEAEENAKKKTTVRLFGLWGPKIKVGEQSATDSQKIEEYNDRIRELRQSLQDLEKTQIETWTGTNVDSFTDSLVNAAAEFESAFGAAADSVNNMLRKSIQDALKRQYLEEPIKNLLSSLSKDMDSNSDGLLDLTGDEANKFSSGVQDALSKYNEGFDAINNMLADAGIDISGRFSNTSTGLKGSIRRDLTEETGGELAGIWRKSSDDTRQIKDYTKIGITHLSKIEANTYNTVVELQNTVKELKTSNTKLESIITNTKPSQTSRDLGL